MSRQDSFEPVALARHDASGQIAAQLRKAIADGVWGPGERLPSEQELSNSFDVSRATTREALKILSATGLIASTRGGKGGTYVSVPDGVELAVLLSESLRLWYVAGNVTLAEVLEARTLLESHCVELAAERRTDEDLHAIAGPVEASANDSLDMAEWLELDVAFHVAITKAAKNRIIELAMTAVHMSREATNSVVAHRLDRAAITAQHDAIYRAIESRNGQRARLALLEHVDYVERIRAEVANAEEA